MTAIEHYLAELEKALITGGRQRRRLLAECRDHLVESGATFGPDEAVRRFGAAQDLAASLDAEQSVRRGLAATAANLVAVLGIAGSTSAVLHGADTDVAAQVAWAVVFFGAAQVTGASLALAALRAMAMRRELATATDVAMLCRRNITALGFALCTMFAAAAALPGHASAPMVLMGPALALVAAVALARTRSMARRLDVERPAAVRSPLLDAATLVRASAYAERSTWATRPSAVLLPTLTVAVAAAFAWDHLDQGTYTSSWTAAGLEAAFTMGGFLLLGPALGLWSVPRRRA